MQPIIRGPKPAIFIAYCIVAALAVYWSSYYPPTRLSLYVEGPPDSTYSLHYWEEGKPQAELGSQHTSIREARGRVEFYIPDKNISEIGLGQGNEPGSVLIKEMRLEGLFASQRWSATDILRDFKPSDDKSEALLTDEGLLVRKGTIDSGINSSGFHDTFRRVSQGRGYVYLLLIFIAVVLYFITLNPYRFASYLSFLLALTVYVGLLKGITDVAPIIFGGLSVLTAVELFLARREFVLILMSLFFSFFMVELGFLAHEHLVKPVPQKLYYFEYPGWSRLDTHLGARPTPSFRQIASAKVNDTYLFKDVVFTTDKKGRRHCPPVKGAKKHALFFGCSFTWGHGLRDDQTMPYYFQSLSDGEYQSYNYGFNAYGASQMYQLLRGGSMLDDVAQKEGIAVYNFIGDHVYRTTPTLRKDRGDAPVFRLNNVGNLDGPFKISERKGLHLWLRLFDKPDGLLLETSPFLRFYIKHHPFGPVSREERVKATAKVVIESKNLYDSRFKGDFYVVIYDKEYLTDDEIRLFAAMLRAEGIHVSALPRMPNPADEDINPLDKHPSWRRNAWAAEHLLKEIKDPSNPKDIVLTR